MPEPEVPALLRAAAQDTLDALYALLVAETEDLAAVHAELFDEYRRELELLFLTYSDAPEGEPVSVGATPTPARRWKGAAFRREQLDSQLASFADLLDALQHVHVDDFDASLQKVADTGFTRTLWLLALGGLTTAALLDAIPTWSGAAEDDGFDGTGWSERLSQWNRVTFEKARRVLSAMTSAGSSWEDTDAMLRGILRTHTDRVVGLYTNEVFRAFTFGGAVAMELAGQGGAEFRAIWLARTLPDGRLDPLVCPVCAAKHMTVTSDRPVDHSHPGCRCIKVPVPRNFTPVAPLSFESFLQGAV